jgi:ubiquinone/menaquinone biosynthesis C-methylase UbiE
MRIFDRIAKTYDAWYDTDEGKAIFNAELKCLESLCMCHQGRWLEVGTGTGRFASGLGVSFGIDPSIPMLNIAAKRSVAVCAGRVEELPFLSGSIDGVLLAMTLCFISDPGKALEECRRILRPEGRLLLGIVPAESLWGLEYQRKKAQSHPVYSLADFMGLIQTISLVENAGFVFLKGSSSLFWHPDAVPEPEPRVLAEISKSAGFVGLFFAKDIR